MAILKNVTLDNGIIANYHNIDSIFVNPVTLGGMCTVGLYFNETSQSNGLKPISFKGVPLPVGFFSTLTLNPTNAEDLVEDHLLTLEEYSGGAKV